MELSGSGCVPVLTCAPGSPKYTPNPAEMGLWNTASLPCSSNCHTEENCDREQHAGNETE